MDAPLLAPEVRQDVPGAFHAAHGSAPLVKLPQRVESGVLGAGGVRKFEAEGVTLFCADAREIVASLSEFDALLTDPPYPNNAGHFVDDIDAAKAVCEAIVARRKMIFWDERERPPISLPLVAVHVWHRSNTNRPDNYEAIYDYCADGLRRASRVISQAVISQAVIFPGLTGCKEATGHPTQKNVKLMQKLLQMTGAKSACDPFMGSGTTAIACIRAGCAFTGIERDPAHFEDAVQRVRAELAQGVLSLGGGGGFSVEPSAAEKEPNEKAERQDERRQ